MFDAQTGGLDFESPVPLQKPVHSSELLYIVLAQEYGGRKIPGAFRPSCLAYQHGPGLVRDSVSKTWAREAAAVPQRVRSLPAVFWRHKFSS